MGRIVHTLLVALVGAGIVHGAVLLLIPAVGESNAWSRLQAQGSAYEVVRIDADTDAGPLHLPDPFFSAAACRIQLSDGIVALAAEGTVPYWSMSIYDTSGHNIFSINDRTAVDGRLNLLIASPSQMAAMRSDPADVGTAIFVETQLQEGIVIVRAFVPDPTFEPSVETFFDGLVCAPR